MGQRQSNLYECETESGEGSSWSARGFGLFPSKLIGAKRESKWNDDDDVGGQRSETQNSHDKATKKAAAVANNKTDGGETNSRAKTLATAADKTSLEQQQRHVRKLSNVSNRNIQLLSMKPRSEKDTYADGLRSRRRSSLINLILGAPSRGPRFSEDLCSLNSHMSELCNFGIDYFPDTLQTQPINHHESGFGAGGGGLRKQRASRPSSINSSLSRLDDGQRAVDLCPNLNSSLGQQQQQRQQQAFGSRGSPPLEHGARRRGSSLSSLTSFEAAHNVQNDRQFGNKAADCREQLGRADDGHSGASQHEDCSTLAADQLEGCRRQQRAADTGERRGPSLCSMFLASVDLTSSLDEPHDHGRGGPNLTSQQQPAKMATAPRAGRINRGARRMMIHRSGSELSLYSAATSSGSSLSQLHQHHYHNNQLYSSARPFSSRASIASVMHEAAGAKGQEATRSGRRHQQSTVNEPTAGAGSHLRETKLIIMLQVCLPFILAGFGNMGAGLVLNQIANWEAFRRVPVFFVLLPSFVGLKGNIEMTLASRLSTLSNLNLLDTSYQRRQAFRTNLILILSQAIGLSLFAATTSVACELFMGKLSDHSPGPVDVLKISCLVVLPTALATALTLVLVSSLVMWSAIWLANKLQVNPDNLSTLMAALYGDVSCVLTYGLFAQLMYSLNQNHDSNAAAAAATAVVWPVSIVSVALVSWPLLVYMARRSRETQELALSSLPPMLAAILVSLGSGAVLSLVVDKFSRVALYQPVVNGFGANLIAVQASRVSTWLWCTALRRLSAEVPPPPKADGGLNFEFEPNTKPPYGSLASFVELPKARHKSPASKSTSGDQSDRTGWLKTQLLDKFVAPCAKLARLLLWSFVNSSPNSVAARLLLVMLIPAHSLYFVVIWLLAPAHSVTLTWPFYLTYISLCLGQVFVLLSICQPLMTMLMRRRLDPDVFGISLLMALADLIGTICLTGGFYLLESFGDPNAT